MRSSASICLKVEKSNMKTPNDLRLGLARQWRNANQREARLLGPGAWPISISIGKPLPGIVAEQPDQVRHHLSAWRGVTIGEVAWETVNYRHLKGDGKAGVQVPTHWTLHKPSDWISAINEASITSEFATLSDIIANVHEQFRSLLVRKIYLTQNLTAEEVITVADVATKLEPGMAKGLPLRAINIAGIDTKFLERHRTLITAMLDIRFDGGVSETGLEDFLDATRSAEQWLLLADLDGNLLPFSTVRVRDKEIQQTALPGQRLLLVENEQCLHLLPAMPDTMVILGAGLNLNWMNTGWLQSRPVAYWGDIDTWGFVMLARARQQVPGLTPLLMDKQTFSNYASRHAVAEPTHAAEEPPAYLSASEQALYRELLTLDRGRLEQEFLSLAEVSGAISAWMRT